MPALKVPHTFSGTAARDAVKRANEEMSILLTRQVKDPEALSDYFLGFLWIEGYKVVPLDSGDR